MLKLAGSQSLDRLRWLNLCSAPGGQRIQVRHAAAPSCSAELHVFVSQSIQNLDGCRRLQVLNLNHNMIERMEGLTALRQLTDLHVAHNRIE